MKSLLLVKFVRRYKIFLILAVAVSAVTGYTVSSNTSASDSMNNDSALSNRSMNYSVTVVPDGKIINHFESFDSHFIMSKDTYDRIAPRQNTVKLIELSTGRCVREEVIDLSAGRITDASGKYDITVYDIFKSPPISYQETPTNKQPLPVGKFYIALITNSDSENETVGVSVPFVVALIT
jgi:hypothetical protein